MKKGQKVYVVEDGKIVKGKILVVEKRLVSSHPFLNRARDYITLITDNDKILNGWSVNIYTTKEEAMEERITELHTDIESLKEVVNELKAKKWWQIVE